MVEIQRPSTMGISRMSRESESVHFSLFSRNRRFDVFGEKPENGTGLTILKSSRDLLRKDFKLAQC